jgi:hypothetical protein
MLKLILVVGLATTNLQAIGTAQRPADESAQRKPTAPIVVGSPRRTQPPFQWDRLPAPPVRPAPPRSPSRL